jgi:hypothetical protein
MWGKASARRQKQTANREGALDLSAPAVDIWVVLCQYARSRGSIWLSAFSARRVH